MTCLFPATLDTVQETTATINIEQHDEDFPHPLLEMRQTLEVISLRDG